MKIIYHHRIGSKDGQAVHLEELIGALGAMGHTVLLVGPGSFGQATFGHDPGLLTRAKQIVPKQIYELAELCHNIVAFPRLLLAYWKFKPDFVYERCNLYSLAGTLLRKTVGAPLILEVNSPLARERGNFGGLGLPGAAAALERWVWRSADFVLPVTEVLAGELRTAGVDGDRLAIIPNAIDPEKFRTNAGGTAVREELGLSDRVVLGFTGFVRPWHGLETVIELLAQSGFPKNVHLLIVGDGPAIPELRAKAETLKVASRVTFTGLVGRDRIAQVIDAFDIALLPQCVDYCSPLKIFEYMAAGKAIVAPDQSNIREVLTSGRSALLFAPDEPKAMAEAIAQLVNDEKLRSALGSEAHALISSRGYTWRKNAERVSALGAAAARRRSGRVVQLAERQSER